jgi:ariadne-1
MQAESMSYTEQQALEKAFEVLQQCRRTLKYTYTFAYYLQRDNQAEIFEHNQADLERATELLSGFLEHEIQGEQTTALQLMDTTRYCDQRRKTLLNHCKDGYSQHYWHGLDPY